MKAEKEPRDEGLRSSGELSKLSNELLNGGDDGVGGHGARACEA